MKMLGVFVLCVCAMMDLTPAADLPEAKDENDQTASSALVKRTVFRSRYRNRYFYYIHTPLTWAEAERNCQSMGGNLASVHDTHEYHGIQRVIMAASHDYKETWIGGSNGQEERFWLWSDGTLFHYTNWCPGKPVYGQGEQHCVLMNHSAQKCWGNLQCHYRHPSVCAKKVY
ncbi:ladderlectin-like [Mastacembelus armatus]|uniref:ladderlectin-like n=1 Tax=Mastacembelus armatus TaxID=205130 RepID=UPI000E45FBD4|nr:ladderlectin-like [Mastacembelus armatus]